MRSDLAQSVYPASLAKVFSFSPLSTISEIARAFDLSVVDSDYSLDTPSFAKTGSDIFYWELPHSGNSLPSCGQFSGKIIACPNDLHHYFTPIKMSCHRPDCPICYPDWAHREAKSVTDRLTNAVILYHKSGKNLGPIKHIILSPPQARAIDLLQTKEGSIELRTQANRILCDHGFLGGCVITHPYRKKIRVNDQWVDEESANNYQRKYINNHENLPTIWVWGPHFHLLGWGHLTKSDDFYTQTSGWLYKNLGPRRSVRATIFYLLTHAGLAYSLSIKAPLAERTGEEVIINDHEIVIGNAQSHSEARFVPIKHLALHTVRWLGIVSCSKICVDYIEKIEEYVECPVCHDLLCMYRSDFVVDLADIDPAFPVVPPPEWVLVGPYVHKTIKKHFVLKCHKIKQTVLPVTTTHDERR